MMEFQESARIPVIDTHVHRVHPDRAPELGNLSGGYIDGENQAYHGRQILLYWVVMEELRKEFKMVEDVLVEEVETERHRRYRVDPQGYYQELIREQKVLMYCLEVGSPLGEARYSEEEINYFNASLPEGRWCSIVRIDRVLEETLEAALLGDQTFEEFCGAFMDAFHEEAEREQTVGLKSRVAYARGLVVEIVSVEDAKWAYETIRGDRGGVPEKKRLSDHILMGSVEVAKEYEIPIQIHTGVGGGNYIGIRTQNLIHLIDFLKDERVKNWVKTVLLHGGHPHEEDTSYLVVQFSNVHVDYSGTSYLCGLKGVEWMATLLERAPLSKAMYGSDDVMFLEVSRFIYRHFQRQFYKLLGWMETEGYLTAGWAREVAEMVKYRNALERYVEIRIVEEQKVSKLIQSEKSTEGGSNTDLGLKGKVVVATGASKGIELGIAKELIQEDAEVAICARNTEETENATKMLAEPGEAYSEVMGMSQEQQVYAFGQHVTGRFRQTDCWANNMGAQLTKDGEEYTGGLMERIYGVRFKSAAFGCQAAFRSMKHHGGSTVNISSLSARYPTTGKAALYGPMRAAVNNLTITMAGEHVAYGVRTNCVMLRYIMTEFNMENTTKEVLDNIYVGTLMQRTGRVEECAKLVVFLCGNGSTFMTGVTIEVSGGRSITLNPDYSFRERERLEA